MPDFNSEKHATPGSDDKSANQSGEGNVGGGPTFIGTEPPQPPPSTDQPHPLPDKPRGNSDPWWKDRKYKLELCGFVVLAIYTIFSGLQWRHMRWANAMTREAINGSNSSLAQTMDKMNWQIRVTQEVANQTLAQARQTAQLVIEAKTQAEKTGKIADSSVTESQAAKRAAETANESLHVSERAYVTVSAPTIDYSKSTLFLQINNAGHIPSGPVSFIDHVSVYYLPDPTKPDNAYLTGTYWMKVERKSVPPIVSDIHIGIVIPGLNQAKYESGRQAFIVAFTASYNDGFSDTPLREFDHCTSTVWNPHSNTNDLVMCDSDDFLRILKENDKYPSKEFEHF